MNNKHLLEKIDALEMLYRIGYLTTFVDALRARGAITPFMEQQLQHGRTNAHKDIQRGVLRKFDVKNGYFRDLCSENGFEVLSLDEFNTRF